MHSAGGKGYQWKDLFLPDGTDLRMRYKGVDYYAKVEGDKLTYAALRLLYSMLELRRRARRWRGARRSDGPWRLR